MGDNVYKLTFYTHCGHQPIEKFETNIISKHKIKINDPGWTNAMNEEYAEWRIWTNMEEKCDTWIKWKKVIKNIEGR